MPPSLLTATQQDQDRSSVASSSSRHTSSSKPFHQRLYASRKHLQPPLDFLRSQLCFKLRHPRQMDMDTALATALDLLKLQPEKVYRAAQNRNEIKGHYSRDDPALALLLVCGVAGVSLVYRLALYTSSLVWGVLWGVCSAVLVFVVASVVTATCTHTLANTYLRPTSGRHHTPSSVEWFYCLDVHCNAALAPFAYASIVQLVLLPFLTRGGLLPTLGSNSLYLLAACEYVRVTVLGFLHLPLVNRDNVLLLWAPAFASVLAWFVLSLANVNLTRVWWGG